MAGKIPSLVESDVFRVVLIGVATAILVHLAVVYLTIPRWSGDLLPLWLAGQAFSSGDFANIYAPVEATYSMQPPPAWTEAARDLGYDGSLFPFVYPPLWAWLFGHVTGFASFSALSTAASIVNPILILLTCVLARRASGSTIGLLPYLIVAHILIYWTVIGREAVLQNQVHILISFLVVLALERSRAGHASVAGGALALAASIKLFPALFVIFWLVSGERRQVLYFTGFGLALGLSSMAVAGWPLHQVFIDHVSAIGKTGFFSPFSFSLDALMSRLAGMDVVPVAIADTSLSASESGRIMIGKKTVAMTLLSQGLMLLLFAVFSVAMSRSTAAVRYTILWPSLLVLIPLLGPLAWGYYFIPATAFAPALLGQYGLLRGASILTLVYAPFQIIAFIGLRKVGVEVQWMGVVLLLGLALAFLLASKPTGKTLRH